MRIKFCKEVKRSDGISCFFEACIQLSTGNKIWEINVQPQLPSPFTCLPLVQKLKPLLVYILFAQLQNFPKKNAATKK